MNDNKHMHYWAGLTVFSIVSLSSMTNGFGDSKEWDREMKWTVTVASVSLILGAFSFFMRMFMTDMFTSNYMEHFAAFVALLFWCVGLPYITNPEHMISVGMDGMLINTNLFFSSWIAFIFAMMLSVSIFPSMMLGDDKVNLFTNHWVGFGTSSLIATANAVMYWRDNCSSTDDSAMCHRDLFAFVLGAFGGFFALVFFVMSHKRLEHVISIVFFAAWCFGVAYFTFDEGPAMHVGTFYFSVWFSFMFSFWMAVHSVMALYNGMCGDAGGEVTTADGDNKVQEETAKHDAEEHDEGAQGDTA